MPAPRTRFVLIETSHAGNVGAVARAMKVMGFDDLVLVRPRWPDVLQRAEAMDRASGATDVLARARSVATLDEALAGMTHLCATVMTPRDFGPPTRTPRAHFDLLLNQEPPALDRQALCDHLIDGVGGAAAPHPSLSPEGRGRSGVPVLPPRPLGEGGGEGLALDSRHEDDPSHRGRASGPGVALLFGSERYGMSNEDVYRCHVALSIPTNPDYGSLNIAAAVQLIAYDWRQALDAHGGGWGVQRPVGVPEHVAADAAQLAGMLAHWEQALAAVGFLNPAAPKKLMPRLQQLFNRAQPSAEEVHILRGIARAMQEAAGAKKH